MPRPAAVKKVKPTPRKSTKKPVEPEVLSGRAALELLVDSAKENVPAAAVPTAPRGSSGQQASTRSVVAPKVRSAAMCFLSVMQARDDPTKDLAKLSVASPSEDGLSMLDGPSEGNLAAAAKMMGNGGIGETEFKFDLDPEKLKNMTLQDELDLINASGKFNVIKRPGDAEIYCFTIREWKSSPSINVCVSEKYPAEGAKYLLEQCDLGDIAFKSIKEAVHSSLKKLPQESTMRLYFFVAALYRVYMKLISQHCKPPSS